MTDEEVGFYHRCLNRSWINGGLPADPSDRARALGKPKAHCDRLWKTVGKAFSPAEASPDRVVNPRQEEERTKAELKSKRATDSVRTRYERRTDEVLRAYDSDNDSGSEVETSEKEKTSTRARPEPWALDELFPQFREAYPAGVATESDFGKAYLAWRELDGFQKLAAIEHVKECDPAYVKLPAKYLRDREWTRPKRPEPKRKESWEKIAEL